MTRITDPLAANLAREIIEEKLTDKLRGEVQTAVGALTKLLEKSNDGTVFSFVRALDDSYYGYYFAVIRSGGLWYSTGQRLGVNGVSLEVLIEWMIGLGIRDRGDLQYLIGLDA